MSTDNEKKPLGPVGWIIIIVVVAAFLYYLLRPATLPPSDDPNYDAPRGRTYGGDTY